MSWGSIRTLPLSFEGRMATSLAELKQRLAAQETPAAGAPQVGRSMITTPSINTAGTLDLGLSVTFNWTPKQMIYVFAAVQLSSVSGTCSGKVEILTDGGGPLSLLNTSAIAGGLATTSLAEVDSIPGSLNGVSTTGLGGFGCFQPGMFDDSFTGNHTLTLWMVRTGGTGGNLVASARMLQVEVR
jgi:hypothetical protein